MLMCVHEHNENCHDGCVSDPVMPGDEKRASSISHVDTLLRNDSSHHLSESSYEHQLKSSFCGRCVVQWANVMVVVL